MAEKCTCCEWRYGLYNMRLETGGEIVDVFCLRCKDHNPVSEDGGRKLKHHKKTNPQPRDPKPPSEKVSRSFECWCCRNQYKKEDVVKLQYTCSKRHSFTFCLYCANKHGACPYDYNKVTSESQLTHLLALDLKDTCINPITPI